MNKLIFSAVFCAAVASASAQTFRPEVTGGAILGGIAGAIIGNNSGNHHGGQGALIGAAAGAILGGAVSESNRDRDWRHTQVRRPRYYEPSRTTRWDDCEFDRRAGYGYAYPRYTVYPSAGNGERALQGALFGGLAGAIIGNNSGRGHGGRGALIGATAGLILGSIADERRAQRFYSATPRFRHLARYYEPVAADEPAPAAAAPQQVTIINNFNAPVTVMASANSLFGR